MRAAGSVPVAVLQAAAWPTWRRWLRWPTPLSKFRAERWNKVSEGLHRLEGIADLAFPPVRRAGIFKGSTVMWDHLAQASSSIDKSRYPGWTFTGTQGLRSRVANPQGALAETISISDFAFDITEIDGICNSQSDDRFFEGVHEFGRDYVRYMRVPIDGAGLAAMSRHREVRLIHSPGTDTMWLQAWDGRLFVRNDGGSHHLAGAAYIACETGRPMRLQAPLSLDWLNVPAWHWLLAQFHILQVPRKYRVLNDVAALAGAAYVIELPNWASQSTLLLIPRHVPVGEDLVALHEKVGLREVAGDIVELLRLQAATVLELEQRFPALRPLLDQIPR